MHMVPSIKQFILILLISLCFPAMFGVTAKGQITEHHNAQGGFCLALPYGPDSVLPSYMQAGVYRFFGQQQMWVEEGGKVLVTVFDVVHGSNPALTQAQTNEAFQLFKKNYLEEIAKEGLKSEEGPYTFEGFKGLEFHISKPKLMLSRAFFSSNRLHLVSYILEDENQRDTFQKILDSYRKLTKDEWIVAKIIAETPAPLPQNRPASDLYPTTAELRLKGPVKRVRETTREKPNGDLWITQELHFDMDGFLTTKIEFHEGYPDVITVWGWIDGKRVDQESAVRFPFGESPRPSLRFTVSGAQNPLTLSDDERKKTDFRYGTHYEAKFDDAGRPTERKRVVNSGLELTVERFNYTENSRTIVMTDPSGIFMSSTQEVYDANGLVAEEHQLNEHGKIVSSIFFEYKLDNKGNWIEKQAFTKATVRRRPVKRTAGTFYRNIVYHDPPEQRNITASVRYQRSRVILINTSDGLHFLKAPT